ncbi:MAG: three-Cys-motif partner protein TcmP [Sedimentisphaerales bacterium]|nr:three-Cys-motif partner protein TcmP [Sedimentisphaerales bacterium]
MAKDIHSEAFPDETKLKLEIFRDYTKQWLPVFLSSRTRSFHSVNIFDFFAGPGRDTEGQPGSPLILLEEVKKYLNDPKLPHAKGVKVRLFYSDSDSKKILRLKEELDKADKQNIEIETSPLDFKEAFKKERDTLRSRSNANLIILDQYGVKQVTPEIFQTLIQLPSTDFMFFIASSFIKRFIKTNELGQHFPDISSEEIEGIPAKEMHRFICNHYQRSVPQNIEFYLAPFSIQKGANYYGIIFGTHILLGLDKFLSVCWNKDKISGQANYNIDNDIQWGNQLALGFAEESTKESGLAEDLMSFLSSGRRNNNELYKFTLEHGCLPKHTGKILKQWSEEGHLKVYPENIKKGAYYLSWEYYKKKEIKAKFEVVK